mmetsp:Transcript_15765/g.31976  ORF Transcript_15765/g.31976 Transcript_15765/m.31976 type:complete len:151 (+) Transcript_15765:281-733(+)
MNHRPYFLFYRLLPLPSSPLLTPFRAKSPRKQKTDDKQFLTPPMLPVLTKNTCSVQAHNQQTGLKALTNDPVSPLLSSHRCCGCAWENVVPKVSLIDAAEGPVGDLGAWPWPGGFVLFMDGAGGCTEIVGLPSPNTPAACSCFCFSNPCL